MPRSWQTVASALLALLLLAQCSAGETPPAPQHPRYSIQLMTSLPIIWGDDATMESILSGQSEPAPIYRHWQEQYDLAAVDSLENLAAEDPDIVMLAQPRAMDPADLSDLDAWVRGGGHVLIFTDPDLAWPSHLPLGDPQRPLVSGLLSPLLGHWGLELVGATGKSAEVVNLQAGDNLLASRGAGQIVPVEPGGAAGVNCDRGKTGLIVRCSVERGQATIVADADFLNAALWPDVARKSPRKSGAVRFVDSLVEELGHAEGVRK